MRLPVRPLLLAALLEVAALLWVAHARPAPIIEPAEAAAFEGQAAVRIAGMAAAIRPFPDGTTALQIVAGGAAIDARLPGRLSATEGTWMVAEGRVVRFSGRLTLWIEEMADVNLEAGPEPERPSWTQVSAEPAAWHARRIQLEGIIERNTLADKEGHRVQLGDGEWPKSGPVRATGFLEYAPSCLCERFTASDVAAVVPP